MYLIAVKEAAMREQVALLCRAGRVDNDDLPISKALSASVEVERCFSKDTLVESFVFLKLNLDEENGSWLSFGWKEHTVDLKARFFDGY